MFSLFELEYPLVKEAGLKFVTFFDAGNSFRNFPGVAGEPFRLQTDAGFGFRWFSPIGPLRFEWGFPLNPRSQDELQMFNFFIGPSF
jgi:outer membrane protein insertion porin family